MLRKIWIELRSSLWFLPTLFVIAAVALALGLIELDVVYEKQIVTLPLRSLLASSAEGARSMLAAIASSMITVAGVAFSVTIVTLSLASTQYTPRILRNFMADRANQGVLGAFVSIFTYCLIVLRAIRSPSEGSPFVPALAVFAGVLLALLSIGCLIFFIHHVAASIQASYILDAIMNDTSRTIDLLLPDKMEEGESEPAEINDATIWHPIASPASGYVQAINTHSVVALAVKENIRLRVERMPGDFVVERAPLVSVDRAVDGSLGKRIERQWAIGDFRTVEQDVGFGFRQIVDVAMKALSPGVNDTSTAVNCIDSLSALLSRLAGRRFASIFPRDDGRVRVLTPIITFRDFVNKSFDEIRLSAPENVTILLQMICCLQRVGRVTRTEPRRDALRDQLRIITDTANETVTHPYDRERINHELRTVREILSVSDADLPLLHTIAPRAMNHSLGTKSICSRAHSLARHACG